MEEDIYITFEEYLSNQMSEEDRKKFEEQLALDPEMSNKLQIYVRWTEFLEGNFSKETEAFKTNLKSISKEHFSKTTHFGKPKVIPLFSKWFAVAASVVLFCSIWFFMQSNEPNYVEYNQHEKAYFTARSEGVAILKEAQDAFNTQAYESAVGYFEQIPQANRNEEINLYYAIALLEVNKFEQAETLLQAIKSGNSVYKEKAIWYLGLSKLKQKDYSSCKQLLEVLPESADDYNKAQEILEKL